MLHKMDYKLSVTVYWNPSIIDRSFCWPVGHYNSFLMDDYPPINGFIYIIHKFWPWRMWFGPNHVQLRRRLKIHQKLDCKVQLKPCENERIFAAKKNLAWFIEKTYGLSRTGFPSSWITIYEGVLLPKGRTSTKSVFEHCSSEPPNLHPHWIPLISGN